MTTTTLPKRARRMAREPQIAAAALAAPPQHGEPPIAAAIKRETKASLVEQMLNHGATLDSLCAATGWQAHTCRAFLTGLRKKGKGIERSKDEDGVSLYRLNAGEKFGEPVVEPEGPEAEG